MIIRRTIEDDIPALCNIVARNYTKEAAEHFFDEVGLSFSTALGRPWFYTAYEDGIVGCAGYGPSWLAYGAFSLFWVNVDPNKQGRGHGHALVQKCLDDLESRANLIILATAVPGFYSKKWGFEVLMKFDGDQMTDTLMGLVTALTSQQRGKERG